VEVDYTDPKNRLVPLSNRAVKEKFALSTLPVRDGSLTLEGKIDKRPQGGPYGLAEWILKCMDSDTGKTLLKVYGFEDADQTWSALRVLFCYIGSLSVDDLAYLTRGLTHTQLNLIFTSSALRCRAAIPTFKVSEDDGNTMLKALKSFKLKMLTPKWLVQNRLYNERVKRTLESKQKKDSMSITLISEDMGDENDLGDSELMDTSENKN